MQHSREREEFLDWLYEVLEDLRRDHEYVLSAEPTDKELKQLQIQMDDLEFFVWKLESEDG